ncbi:11-oxo-beta-amyrin 30-oxidase [Bertholletia excelsa]
METYAKKLLGEGLATSEGEKWIKLRRLANHAFRAESLKNMVPAMIESVEMMLERWKPHEGQEIEVFGEFRMLTSDVISKTAFGSSYLEGKSIFDKLTQMGAILSRNVYKVRLPIFSKLWKNGDDIQSDHIERGIIDSFIEMVKKREKLKAETGSYGNDLLGLLVMANNDADENNRITVKEVVDECRIFYFAGHETTINLLGWATLLLAVHTDWQEKAREEVLALFAQQNPNPEGLARMKVVTMILNETLRLFPPAFNLTRKVQNEVRLGELLLPANIHVFIPILSLHCNPQIWGEDANLFKPERFSEGVAKATNNNLAAFIPFGLGPRSCVGNNFAMNEAKIALSMILQRYAFTLSPTYVHSPAHILTVNPRYGLQIRLHPL